MEGWNEEDISPELAAEQINGLLRECQGSAHLLAMRGEHGCAFYALGSTVTLDHADNRRELVSMVAQYLTHLGQGREPL